MRLLVPLLLLILAAPSCIVVTTDRCVDGRRNGDESDVDCGGSCGACSDGRRCFGNSDCRSGACVGGVCGVVSAGCGDGVRNGNESDVDCGGSCAACPNGRQCAAPADCASALCLGNVCAACAPPTGPAFNGSFPLVNITPNAAATIPQGDIGFAVTSNGLGGYRVVWSDTQNTAACFQGILRAFSTFDSAQTMLLGSPQTTAPAANELRFASAPGNMVDGIDLVTTQAPPAGQADLYLEAFISGTSAGFNIYAGGGAAPVGTNPVAFRSP